MAATSKLAAAGSAGGRPYRANGADRAPATFAWLFGSGIAGLFALDAARTAEIQSEGVLEKNLHLLASDHSRRTLSAAPSPSQRGGGRVRLCGND